MAALLGDANALYKIGDFYRNGYYVQKNLDFAFAIYLRAYKQAGTDDDNDGENTIGQIRLRIAECVLYGLGCDKDIKGALNLFLLAEFDLRKLKDKGNPFYDESIEKAIRGQEQCRALIANSELEM